LRTAAELKSLNDFAKKLPVPAECHLYLLLCDSTLTVSELDRLFSVSDHVTQEAFHSTGSDALDAFWIVPKGQTLTSPFGSKVLGSKKYRNLLTSRNQNTIERILALIKTD
jgi:uncharacterized protein (DUF1697 family)